MEEELASPRGEREQKVTADMLDKVRALLPASRLRCFACAWRPAAHGALVRQAQHRQTGRLRRERSGHTCAVALIARGATSRARLAAAKKSSLWAHGC